MDTLLIFLTTFFLLSATPGPNMLASLGMGIRFGLGGAVWGGLGMCAGLGGMALLSALGVGALLATSPIAFQALKWAGVIYLAWLGGRTLWAARPAGAGRGPTHVGNPGEPRGDGTDRTGTGIDDDPPGPRLFIRGVIITLGNPKALIFLTAFFPQFIDPGIPVAPQLAVLIGVMLSIEFGWLMAYAAGGKGLASTLSSRGGGVWIDRLTGALLLGAALLLAFASHA